MREKKTEELASMLAEMKEDLFRLKFKHVMGHLTQKSHLRRAHRNIARIHTILKERSRAGTAGKT